MTTTTLKTATFQTCELGYLLDDATVADFRRAIRNCKRVYAPVQIGNNDYEMQQIKAEVLWWFEEYAPDTLLVDLELGIQITEKNYVILKTHHSI